MPWSDTPLAELRQYRTSTPEPAALDEWWARRLAAERQLAHLRGHLPAPAR